MRLARPIDSLADRLLSAAGGALSLAGRALRGAAGALPLPFGGDGPERSAPSGPLAQPDDRSHTPPTGDTARIRPDRGGRPSATRSAEASATGVAVAGGLAIPDPPAAAEEHVSEEATLVAAHADAGAEDGPGPNIEVAEPWQGYRALRARDVADRLVTADAATAAAVELFERAHKGRKLVIEAAAKRLRTTG